MILKILNVLWYQKMSFSYQIPMFNWNRKIEYYFLKSKNHFLTSDIPFILQKIDSFISEKVVMSKNNFWYQEFEFWLWKWFFFFGYQKKISYVYIWDVRYNRVIFLNHSNNLRWITYESQIWHIGKLDMLLSYFKMTQKYWFSNRWKRHI